MSFKRLAYVVTALVGLIAVYLVILALAASPDPREDALVIDRCLLVDGKNLPLYADEGADEGSDVLKKWAWGFDRPAAIAFRYAETKAWWVTPIAVTKPEDRLPLWAIDYNSLHPLKRKDLTMIKAGVNSTFTSELVSLSIREDGSGGSLTVEVVNRQYAVGTFRLLDCVRN
ncbi:MAG: hypothetical protein EOP06_23040 [Proteobacteria bacterium]|nr:MAG: hypothetical protein EOP06_23040 [Pseudomonadota bacterium]